MDTGFSREGLKLAEAFEDAGVSANVLLSLEAQVFSPEGYGSFFKLFNGFPLHEAARSTWVPHVWQAMADRRGVAQECHREAGKTTVISLYLALYLIGHRPAETGGIIRINDQKAAETTKAIAAIIESDPRWKMVFPNVVPDYDKGWGEKGYYVKDDSIPYGEWTAIRASKPQYPTFVGYGWKSGSVLGHRFSNFCIVDDIHDRDNTRSEKQLIEVKTFVKKTLGFTIMEGCVEIWNFTPWRMNDVYAYILATGEYIHSKTPVMVPSRKGDPGAELWPPTPLNRNYPEAGDIPLSGRYYIRYHPEKWTWDRIAKEYRRSGAVEFSQMMMLDLEATMGRILPREWLRYYPWSEEMISWPAYMGVDYASVQDKLLADDPDYFALAVLLGIPGGGLILYDGYRGILTKGEALQKVATEAVKYPNLQLIGVESIGGGREYYTDLSLTRDVYGRPLKLMPIKHHSRSKGERFEQYMGPFFQMGNVWISEKTNEFIRRFEDEWLSYPDNDYDDVLDAVYMAIMAGEGRLGVKRMSNNDIIGRSKSPFSAITRRLRE